MVTEEEKLIAEMDNLMANVHEDRKLIIRGLLDIRTSVLESLKLLDDELKDLGVDPNEKTTNETEW